MKTYLGTVTGVTDPNKFVIKFEIPNVIQDAIAFPIETTDEPNEGNQILVYEMESIFGFSFLYKKLRLEDYTRMKIGDSIIELHNDSINIATSGGGDISISSSGDIDIKSDNNINIRSGSNLNLKIEGNANINVSGTATLDASRIKFPNRSVTPTGSGPFCAIAVCPYTGQPHVGNTV